MVLRMLVVSPGCAAVVWSAAAEALEEIAVSFAVELVGSDEERSR